MKTNFFTTHRHSHWKMQIGSHGIVFYSHRKCGECQAETGRGDMRKEGSRVGGNIMEVLVWCVCGEFCLFLVSDWYMICLTFCRLGKISLKYDALLFFFSSNVKPVSKLQMSYTDLQQPSLNFWQCSSQKATILLDFHLLLIFSWCFKSKQTYSVRLKVHLFGQ